MAVVELLTPLLERPIYLIPAAFAVAILYQLSIYFYNIFLHPLRNFSGPWSCRASCIPLVKNSLDGRQQLWVTGLHEKYGEIVRISPNELSFSSGDAWKDVYGHRRAGQLTLTKSPHFYQAPVADEHERVVDIVNSGNEDHTRIRRIFSNAFSDRALKLQEPLFLTYVNKLIANMNRVIKANPEHKFNMVNQYNFTTFDVMSDLTFGEPLNLLDNSDYHPWVTAMLSNFHFGTYVHSIRYYSLLENVALGLLARLAPNMESKRKLHSQFSEARVDKRLEKKEARPDIWGLVLEKDEQLGMTRKEMYANASAFMIAGTETTATLLSGLTYYLLVKPEAMKKLTDEIRGEFKTPEDITIEKLQRLKYLNACVEEGLRMYPPVSNGLPRIVPQGGVVINGTYVPAGSCVMLTQLAAYRNPKNFRDPYEFIPERWLSEEYNSDKKHALQPFSVGPRNCIGKNMAYHEMRIILSKVLWSFDLRLCPESQQWNDQKVYVLWDKKPLICQLVPAAGAV